MTLTRIPPVVRGVIAAVASEHGLAAGEILSPGYYPQIARARLAVIRRLLDGKRSEATVGRYLGITQQAVSIALKRAER